MYNGLPYNYLKKMCKKHNMDLYGIHSMHHLVATAMIAKATDEIIEMLHLDEKYSSQTAV